MPLTIVLNTLYSSKGREREREAAKRHILAHFVRMGLEKDGVEVATARNIGWHGEGGVVRYGGHLTVDFSKRSGRFTTEHVYRTDAAYEGRTTTTAAVAHRPSPRPTRDVIDDERVSAGDGRSITRPSSLASLRAAPTRGLSDSSMTCLRQRWPPLQNLMSHGSMRDRLRSPATAQTCFYSRPPRTRPPVRSVAPHRSAHDHVRPLATTQPPSRASYQPPPPYSPKSQMRQRRHRHHNDSYDTSGRSDGEEDDSTTDSRGPWPTTSNSTTDKVTTRNDNDNNNDNDDNDNNDNDNDNNDDNDDVADDDGDATTAGGNDDAADICRSQI
ncbi:hypothetical protein EDB85DRAFT_1894618 [Lactarius pseudohatsudake]|nr:hypothetical protein EDB85DRAFT_1894618 [Lactarius pseudohatsudake]